MSRLSIHLFGYPKISVDDHPVKFERRKTLALFAYLAVTGLEPSGKLNALGREQLASLLWPDTSGDQASAYLRQALWDINKAAGENWLVKTGATLNFDPQADIWVDVGAFEACFTKWKSTGSESQSCIGLLSEAAQLYTEDFLAGFTLRDSPGFDDWQAFEAETYRMHLGQMLEALARAHAESQDYASALLQARRWLSLDPFNEAAHRGVMRLLDENGQRSAALRQYEICRSLLLEELGVEPEAETRELLARLRNRVDNGADRVSDKPPSSDQPQEHDHRIPSGTVTFLFSDIEGSTQLWERQPQAMQSAFSRQEQIIRSVMEEHGGYVYKMIGDAFQVAFATAPRALLAAITAQRSLQAENWGGIGPLKVRMALHSGVTEERGDDYVGPELNRVARLMSAGHGGQVLLNGTTYELLRGHLPQHVSLRDLGQHSLKDLANPEHIYQVVVEDLAQDFPPLKTASVAAYRLPVQTTPFVGREDELFRIEAMLADPACRLVTLTGIGGSGKTRLAIQAAGHSRIFSQQVYYAGLAAISSLEDLVPAIAEAMGIKFNNPVMGSLPLEAAQTQLLGSLSEKRALLVVDNFEQLVGCSSFLAQMLAAAPDLKLLVTSRERLNLPGEWVVEVTGLPFPGSGAREEIPRYAAVRLFVEAAERTDSLFLPGEHDWAAIARICQLLEGMPLGVEMAATWIRMLTPKEIAAEIERGLDFLSGSWRGMPERHRTLGAVFEYSWLLLSKQERELFSRLSVFRGGFDRQAALEIAGASLPRLSALMDKSLLRRVSSGRFEVHPVLKQFAAVKLSEQPDLLEQTRSRHAAYYSDWLCQMFEKLKGREQLSALTALRGEKLNLRESWRWLVAQPDFDTLRRILPPLILYQEMNDQRVEVKESAHLIEDMLRVLRPAYAAQVEAGVDESDNHSHAILLALGLAVLGELSFRDTPVEKSSGYRSESLALAQKLPDCTEKAMSILLNCVGNNALTIDQVLDLLQQVFSIFKRLKDEWGMALAQLILADNANFGHAGIEIARAGYLASQETFSRLGSDWGLALCSTGLAILNLQAGNLEEAYSLGHQSLEMYRRMDCPHRMAEVKMYLVDISQKLGKIDETRQLLKENLAFFSERGDEVSSRYFQDQLMNLIT